MEKKFLEGLEKKSRAPMFLSNAYGNVGSRYLKPSTGSCHDLCKNGHKHEFDDERKQSVHRRFMKNSIVSDNVQDHVGDPKKSSELKLKASAGVLKQNIQAEGLLPAKKRIEYPSQTILRDSSVDVKKKKKTEITLRSDPNIFKEKLASYMKETITSSAFKVNMQKTIAVKKLHGFSKLNCEKKNVSQLSKKIDDQLNATTNNLEGCSRNSDSEAGKNIKIPKVGDRNFRKLQKATTPVHDNACLKVRKFKNDDELDIHENIQEIIVNELSEIEKKDKRRVRRTALVDEGSSLPYKLKFKRGRVIDVRTTENVGPRKLRFRKGRVLDENCNGEFMKRFLRKSEKGNMKAPNEASIANSSQSSTVMLKHQDAHVKKEMQALFNHVIEETANKLVKTRKSKVKALVGAFETVISLQETKAIQQL